MDYTKRKIGRGVKKATEKVSTRATKVKDGVKKVIHGAQTLMARNRLGDAARHSEIEGNKELTSIQVNQLLADITAAEEEGGLPLDLWHAIGNYAMPLAYKTESKMIKNQKEFAGIFFGKLKSHLLKMTEEKTTNIYIRNAEYMEEVLSEAQVFTAEKPVTLGFQADLNALQNAIYKILDKDADKEDNKNCCFALLDVLTKMYLTRENLPDNHRLQDQEWLSLIGKPEGMLVTHEREKEERKQQRELAEHIQRLPEEIKIHILGYVMPNFEAESRVPKKSKSSHP